MSPGTGLITAGQLRQALALLEIRGHPLFQAAAGRKAVPEAVRRASDEWRWAAEHLPVERLLVYTDGSAILNAGWLRALCRAGWAAAFFCPDTGSAGGMLFLGAVFAPVAVGAQAPGSFGVTKTSALAAERTAVAATLALLRSRVEAAGLAATLATKCKRHKK